MGLTGNWMLQKRRSVKFLNGREKGERGKEDKGEREREREQSLSDLQENIDTKRSNTHIIRISVWRNNG